MPIAATVSAAGSAITAGGEKRPVAARYPREKNVQHLLHEMIAKYPELKGLELPGIAPEAMDLISKLMKGGLPAGVEKAWGQAGEMEYGTALAGMPQGVGPIALGKMRAGIMGRVGAGKAMMGYEGAKFGLQMTPQISELMMHPQKFGYAQQRARWQDILSMFTQHPTGAYLTGGQHLPTPGGGTYRQY